MRQAVNDSSKAITHWDDTNMIIQEEIYRRVCCLSAQGRDLGWNPDSI